MAKRPDVEYIRFYTNGSAALKPEPVPYSEATPKRAPQKIKRIKIFVDPVAILSIFVALCMLATVISGFVRLKQANDKVAAMQTYVDRLEAEHTVLAHRYESGYDLDAVRRTALALDMIPAEEATHITIAIPPEAEPITNPTLWERLGTFLTGLFA